MRRIEAGTIDLVMTSPPFALQRKKDYGNVPPEEYVGWMLPFAIEMKRVIKENGSIVIDLGASWTKGIPTKSLYQWRLLIALCDIVGLHLARVVYWYNPAKLPSPAEWVTVRRIRVKEAVNSIFWLSKDPFPKADNRRVLRPYSRSMLDLLENGYKAKKRPSGHDISEKFSRDNKGAIPPNLLEIANTESNSRYLRACKACGIDPHPARYPADVPRVFIDLLTDEGDTVRDSFAGADRPRGQSQFPGVGRGRSAQYRQITSAVLGIQGPLRGGAQCKMRWGRLRSIKSGRRRRNVTC